VLPPGESRLVCSASLITVRKVKGHTDGQTNRLQIVTLRLPLDAASIITVSLHNVFVQVSLHFR